LHTLYGSSNYFSGGAYRDYMRDDWIRIAQGQRRIKRIVARTGIAGGRLLDVASASGFFGVAARSVGFDVTCIEPDEKLARMGREAYGLLIIAATVEDCELEPAAYDIVTIWGADVHFLHPVHSIEKLVTALKPGGVLALTYQASDHWIRRIFPRMMTGWHMIYNHTDRSFEATLRRLGLELVSRELEWQTVTVDHICRLLRLNAPGWLRVGVVRAPAISFRTVIARKS